MSGKILFSECDENLRNLLLKKQNLSKSSIKKYDVVFNEIYELSNYTPSQLLIQARKEENPNIMEYVGELEDRTVSEVQIKYYEFLSDKDYSENTKKLKISLYRNFLKEYGIEKPKTITFKSVPLVNEELSVEDIFKALNLCNSLKDKAIISFVFSSGIVLSDLINLSVSDLIKSSEIYFDENEDHTIHNLLNKNPWNIIPSWKINTGCFFNTPEATFYIFEYLKSRKEINTDDALFKSQRGNYLNLVSITNMFFKLNKKLGSESNNQNNYGKFRYNNLKALFQKICNENNVNVEDITKSDYEKLISYLTLNSVNKVKYLEQKLQEKNNEIEELKKEIKKLKSKK